MQQLHAFVTGRVQGVNFRAWTSKTAQQLGLAGWVRNLSDGRVELVAQGDEAALKELERKLHDGPSMANVTDLDANYSQSDENYGDFTIRR
jgi:acylphosphatase